MSVPAWAVAIGGAQAACAPAVPVSGQTVTCTDTQPTGFIAPAGVTGLTLNIQNGAVIGFQQTGFGGNPNFTNVRINDASTVNNDGTITNTAPQVRDNYGVSLFGSDTTLANSGTISLVGPVGSTTQRLYGVISSSTEDDVEFSNVNVVNSGTISVVQNGNALARGVYAGEAIESMIITNGGTISAERTAASTGTTALAAIDSDDDVEELTVINTAGGTISGKGSGARAIQGRAQEYTIVNDGLITNLSGGDAIAIYQPGEASLLNTANGTIVGDVRFTDTDPLNPAFNGFRNSETMNLGLIQGKVVYGGGNHALSNAGTITGDVTFGDVATSVNTVTLATSSVINGNIIANGLGTNSLVLTDSLTPGGGGGDDDDDDRRVSRVSAAAVGDGQGTLTSNVSGFTTLTQTAGIWTLAAGSTQSFSQGARIDGGTLFVDSTLNAPAVSVEEAGTLGGIGIINGNLANEGVVAPGSAANILGTLTLNGNYSQEAGARFSVNGTADGTNAKLQVNGTAELAGTAFLQASPGIYVPGTRYTILTATSGVSGGFDSASSSGLPTLLAPVASTDETNAYLTLAQQSFGLVATTRNQRGVAGGLDVLLAGNTAALTYLDNQSDRTLAGNLDRLAGQGYANIADPQFRAGRAFTDALMARAYQGVFESGPTGFTLPPATYAADLRKRGPVPEPRFVEATRGYALWATGYGQTGNVSATVNATGRNETIAGFAAGVDMHPSAGTFLGIAAGYGSVDVNLKQTGERAHTDNAQVGLYGGVSSGPLYAIGTVGYAHADGRLNRSLAGLQILQPGGASGRLSGNQFLSAGEAGYRYAYAPDQAFTPFVGFQVSTFSQDRVNETGGGLFDLTVLSKDFLSARSQVGGRLEHFADFGGHAVTFAIKAAYVHDFADVGRTIQSSFVLAPAVPFTVAGRPLSRDRALVGIGIGAQLAPGWTGFVNYDAEVAVSDTIQAGRAGARYSF